MCGIIGSPNKELALNLYTKNLERGDYSYGGLTIINECCNIIKGPGVLKPYHLIDVANYYLLHSRAPTSNTTKFEYHNSHPFIYNEYAVAHNGIIRNFNELNPFGGKNYVLQSPVDSSIIPYLLSKNRSMYENLTEPQIIQQTLESLDGIFGVWIYSFSTNTIYLARCASTIYYNDLTNSFSSAACVNYKLLKEGIIYDLTLDGIKEVGEFKYNSPYFVA